MESKIRDYLLEKQALNGWKQDEMAGILGVPKGTLSRWIRGLSEPDFDSMKKIAEGLNVPFQEVIDAREGKYQPLTPAEREGIEISKKYTIEGLLEALRNKSDEELIEILKARFPDPDDFKRVVQEISGD